MARPFKGVFPINTVEDPAARDILHSLVQWALSTDGSINSISRGSIPSGGGGSLGVTDHGLLTGLLDDDHPNLLSLLGRVGGQVGLWSDTTAPFLSVDTLRASSGTPLGLGVFRVRTSDDVSVLRVDDDGEVLINVPYTTYASGNPIALTLQMLDATASAGTFFKIRTGGTPTDVFTVSYHGQVFIDATSTSTPLVVQTFGGANPIQIWEASGGSDLSWIEQGGAFNGDVVVRAGKNLQLVDQASSSFVLITDPSGFVSVASETFTVSRVKVRKNTGALVGSRKQLNFIEGSNVTLTVTDDAGNEEVDITIAASGAGGSTGFVTIAKWGTD